MTLTEKLDRLQDISGAKTTAAFCALLGVNVVTLGRLRATGTASARILARVASAFQNLTADDLLGDKPLPDGVRLRADQRSRLHQDDPYHQGRQLGRYLDRLGRGSRAELAGRLGVSRSMISVYERTTRFTPDVMACLLVALDVPAEVVFTSRQVSPLDAQATRNALPAGVTLRAVPLIRPLDRLLTADDLARFVDDYEPLVYPDRTYYVNARRFAGVDFASALAVDVVDADKMTPALRAGAVVLAVVVPPDEWPDLLDASVLVQFGPPARSRLQIRRVYRNELRTGNLLEVGGYDRAAGSTLTLRREDITALYRIVHVLESPV